MLLGIIVLVRKLLGRPEAQGPRFPDFYTTPADWSKCKNLQEDGPTPCWHPHCDCQEKK
jgi:hypothetical protein